MQPVWPLWEVTARLAALFTYCNAGEVQIQVGDLDLGLRSSGTCVVEKQKQGMVAPALRSSPVPGSEKGVHLWPFEIRNGFAGFPERYRTDRPGPFDVHRTLFADKAGDAAGASGRRFANACRNDQL